MSEDVKNCPFCGEEILAVAKKCKHCGSDLGMGPHEEEVSSKSEASSPVHRKKSSPWVLVVLVAIAVLLFFGNFHIITGGSVGPKIVSRDSFGFSEIFINVDAITSMPWISAKSRFPLGCRVLAREGIIESDEAFKARIEREAKEEFDKAMRDAQKETEKLLRDLQ